MARMLPTVVKVQVDDSEIDRLYEKTQKVERSLKRMQRRMVKLQKMAKDLEK